METTDTHEITVTREMKAPPDSVAALWRDAGAMMRRFGLPGFTNHAAAFEPREGGARHVTARGPDGELTTVRGTITAREPGRRSVQLWHHAGSEGRPALATPALEPEAEVLFDPTPEGTRVTVHHRRIRRTPALVETRWGARASAAWPRWPRPLERPTGLKGAGPGLNPTGYGGQPEETAPMPDPMPMQRAGTGRLAHAPKEHPPVAPKRVGVLLANLGTPDATDYWSMRRYLNEFLSDKRVIEWPSAVWQPILQLIVLTKRPFSSGEAYRGIWNEELDESPLLTITRAQTDKLRAHLEALFGDGVVVEFGMRYGNPSTESVIRRMQAQGCERIVFFPLYPQYAAATTATACDQAFRALMKLRWQPAVRTVPAYHDHPAYIQALAQSVERAYAGLEARPTALVASYHGLPQSYFMKGDPYHCHCQKSSRLLAERLGWARGEIHTTFQSRFGPEEWLQPYTVEYVAKLAEEGHTRIAVMAPGFASDCVETLEEINEEIKEAFEEAGGEHFHYIPCLNDDAAHIEMMAEIVRTEAQGWLPEATETPAREMAAE